MWMDILKHEITGKYSEKRKKNNNLLKTKRILKLKYKLSGALFSHLACQGAVRTLATC